MKSETETPQAGERTQRFSIDKTKAGFRVIDSETGKWSPEYQNRTVTESICAMMNGNPDPNTIRLWSDVASNPNPETKQEVKPKRPVCVVCLIREQSTQPVCDPCYSSFMKASTDFASVIEWAADRSHYFHARTEAANNPLFAEMRDALESFLPESLAMEFDDYVKRFGFSQDFAGKNAQTILTKVKEAEQST